MPSKKKFWLIKVKAKLLVWQTSRRQRASRTSRPSQSSLGETSQQMASLVQLGGTSGVAMTAHYVIVEAAAFGSLQDARCSFSAFVLCSILPRPPTSARIQCHHHSLSHRNLVCSDSHSWWWTAQVAACTQAASCQVQLFTALLYFSSSWCSQPHWTFIERRSDAEPKCPSDMEDLDLHLSVSWQCDHESDGLHSQEQRRLEFESGFHFLVNVPRGNVVHSH